MKKITKLRTMTVACWVSLTACGSSDEPPGPPPPSSLSNPIWEVASASDASGQPIQPITSRIGSNRTTSLEFDLGKYIRSDHCYRIAVPVKFPESRIEPRSANLGNDAALIGCEDDDAELIREAVDQFMKSGITWVVSDDTPATLTLTSDEGAEYVLTARQ